MPAARSHAGGGTVRREVIEVGEAMAVSLPAVWTTAAILLLLVVMLWFTWGTQRNISRGNDVLRWLQSGLPTLGRRATVKWLGSSAVELGIVEPASPFAEVSVVVVLEPRDVPWFWAWSRGRGRRDFLILRARLERPPRFEIEAGDVAGWTGSDRLDRLDEDAWASADWGSPTLRVLHPLGFDPAPVRPAYDRLAEVSGGVWRMSVRREPPHLEVHVLPPRADGTPDGAPGLDTSPSEALVGAFADLARLAGRG